MKYQIRERHIRIAERTLDELGHELLSLTVTPLTFAAAEKLGFDPTTAHSFTEATCTCGKHFSGYNGELKPAIEMEDAFAF